MLDDAVIGLIVLVDADLAGGAERHRGEPRLRDEHVDEGAPDVADGDDRGAAGGELVGVEVAFEDEAVDGGEDVMAGEPLLDGGDTPEVPEVVLRHGIGVAVDAGENGWDDDAEAMRWLRMYGELVQPGFVDSISDWRVMTPKTYESEFHLPEGHATSFAGGPLAAIRNRNPELTRYQTSVPGLYLTGAATFPGAGVWGASGRNAATVVLHHHAG